MQQRPLFDDASPDHGFTGRSPEIKSVLRTIQKLQNDTSTVLITGESGVGKELVARALHRVSPLARKQFIAVDSASLVGSLMESELFGHLKGAFTGATHDKKGLVQAAEGGTLFFDEIGELSLEVQAKLLRLLQERECRPIGATQSVRVDVRILTATNRDLAAEVEQGQFRKDLYYRLNVIRVHIPPLRQRKLDIPLLVRHFVEIHARQQMSFSDDVVQRLMQYDWPGNVRELENVVRRMIALKSNPIVELHDLPSDLVDPAERAASFETNGEIVPLAEIERRHILKTLEHTRGDVITAAKLLGIGKTTLYRKLKKYRGKSATHGTDRARMIA